MEIIFVATFPIIFEELAYQNSSNHFTMTYRGLIKISTLPVRPPSLIPSTVAK